MRIRLMQSDDCAGVAGVLNHAISTGVAHFGTVLTNADEVRDDWNASRNDYPWLVAASDDDSFIGFAKASPWKSRKAYAWTVESGIYLVEGAHGMGVGKALYEALFTLLAAQGYRIVLSGVSVPNPASERLHETMGMSTVGDIAPAGYKHGRWVSVRIYQKLLGACDETDTPLPIRDVQGVWDELQGTGQVNS
ncbi:MAG: GNAT family N-acetyltransferase [Phycisphaerales bacterium JB052]